MDESLEKFAEKYNEKVGRYELLADEPRFGLRKAARSRKCMKLFRIVWSTGILLHIAENVLLCVS